jgi:hypothetical protein
MKVQFLNQSTFRRACSNVQFFACSRPNRNFDRFEKVGLVERGFAAKAPIFIVLNKQLATTWMPDTECDIRHSNVKGRPVRVVSFAEAADAVQNS